MIVGVNTYVFQLTSLPSALRHRQISHEYSGHPVVVAHMNEGICMSAAGFTIAGMLAFALFGVAIMVAIAMLRSNSNKA